MGNAVNKSKKNNEAAKRAFALAMFLLRNPELSK